MNIYDIKSVDWQLGLTRPGDIVESLTDIKQCIGLIITTSKGSNPVRLEFGTDIYKLVDKPVNVAAPAIVSEILTGIQLWEPRVKVNKLVYSIDGEKILFEMNIQVILSGQNADLIFEIDRLNRAQRPQTDGRAFSRGFSFAFS